MRSFTRIIYKTLNPQNLSINVMDLLNPKSKLRQLVDNILNGKYIDVIENQELQKSIQLADCINHKEELLPLLNSILNDKTSGNDIKQAVGEHRLLVHALFYNKYHVLRQLEKIIDELEKQAVIQEFTQKSIKVIPSNTLTRQ